MRIDLIITFEPVERQLLTVHEIHTTIRGTSWNCVECYDNNSVRGIAIYRRLQTDPH